MSLWKLCSRCHRKFESKGVAVLYRNQFTNVGVMMFFASVFLGFVASRFTHSDVPVMVGVAIGVYLLFAVKVVDQWEKVAVLRFGRYRGLRPSASRARGERDFVQGTRRGPERAGRGLAAFRRRGARSRLRGGRTS